jgi:Na+(H+)/acetate symporter ActP
MSITWATLIPDVLVMLLPLLGGMLLLITSFSWAVVIGMVLLTALSLSGSAFVRTQIACKYCKQRESGCPAEKFFGGAQAK